MTTMKGAHTALDEMKGGEFKRSDGAYTNEVCAGTQFEPAADRYHLYISLACPWACGCLTALKLKGLDGVISYSVAHPTWNRTKPDNPDDSHFGWVFRSPGSSPLSNLLGHGSIEADEDCIPDYLNNCQSVREVYELADDTAGKYSTPVLWDKKHKAIVSNESMTILRSFNSAFNQFAKNPDVDLFPAAELAAAEDLNKFIYPNVNNGVYRCGFAKTQAAYELALRDLFTWLDTLDELLGQKSCRGFLTGDKFTWLDLRLYHTLVRFDPVYHTYFKTNLRKIATYPNLLEFMRRAYAIPEVKATTNIKHIKEHYFTSHPTLNTYAIIPGDNGPNLEQAEADHEIKSKKVSSGVVLK